MLRSAAAQVSLNTVLHVMAGFRSHQFFEVFADHLSAGIAGQVLGCPIYCDDRAFKIVEKDDVVRIFEQLTKPLFARPESLFRTVTSSLILN